MENLLQKTSTFSCDVCRFQTRNKQDYTRHLSTTKHKHRAHGDENTPDKTSTFSCETCLFQTRNKQDYTRHLSTTKHKHRAQGDTNSSNNNSAGYSCGCGKYYAVYGSLWRHKKQCDGTPTQDIPIITNEVVLAIVQQNKELQHLLIEQNRKFMEKIAELASATHNPVSSEK
jgi:hypothetical protein